MAFRTNQFGTGTDAPVITYEGLQGREVNHTYENLRTVLAVGDQSYQIFQGARVVRIPEHLQRSRDLLDNFFLRSGEGESRQDHSILDIQELSTGDVPWSVLPLATPKPGGGVILEAEYATTRRVRNAVQARNVVNDQTDLRYQGIDGLEWTWIDTTNRGPSIVPDDHQFPSRNYWYATSGVNKVLRGVSRGFTLTIDGVQVDPNEATFDNVTLQEGARNFVNENGVTGRLDAVTFKSGIRILVKNESNPTFNGVYELVARGLADDGIEHLEVDVLLERVRQFDETSDLVDGVDVTIGNGDTNANMTFELFDVPEPDADFGSASKRFVLPGEMPPPPPDPSNLEFDPTSLSRATSETITGITGGNIFGDIRGLFGTDDTLYVVRNSVIWAYDINTRARVPSKDLSSVQLGSVGSIGITAGLVIEDTLYISINGRDRIQAYDYPNVQRNTARDLILPSSAGSGLEGLTHDGVHIWVYTTSGATIYAFNESDRSRDSGSDIAGTAFPDVTNNYRDIFSDGTTIWITNVSETPALHAITIDTKQAASSKNISFSGITSEGNRIHGLWVDLTKEKLWVSVNTGRFTNDAVYTYDVSTQ